jgi:SPP1 family predicted phage head-tail adaptor
MANYPIQAGELRSRITLQVPTESKDAGGAQKVTFANATTNPIVYARWINAHGAEVTQNATKSVQRATVTIRHRTDIKTTWRILKNSEAWQIISIDPVQDRGQWVELIVERVKGTV